MPIILDNEFDFNDILLKPKYSEIKSREDVNLERVVNVGFEKISLIPIIAANMDGVGTLTMASELKKFKIMTALTKHTSNEKIINYLKNDPSLINYIFFSIGMRDDDYHKLLDFKNLYKQSPKFICVDVANGYTKDFLSYISVIKHAFPQSYILAGNVVDSEGASKILQAGASSVKLGIGNGGHCTTRIVAGIGRPQGSAVLECVRNGYDVCSDGGCSHPSDIVKAFALGARWVMVGSMLAATNQSEMPVIELDGQPKQIFYGMSSAIAQKEHGDSLRDYRSSEGRVSYLPHRGEVSNIIKHILGGIRSALTYVGCENLNDLPKHANFYKVNNKQTHNKTYEAYTIKDNYE